MKSVCYSDIPAVDAALLAKAGALAVSDLHEALGPIAGRRALLTPAMRPLINGSRAFGQAVTCEAYPGDNLAIHLALHVVKKGQILVFTNGGSADGALWGELAATMALRKGVAGVVVDGAIRDTDALRAMNFPVWSTIISPSHPEKRGPAAVNVPVVCGGVTINPGDLIVADSDGVLAIPPAMIAEAAEGAIARMGKEAQVKKAVAEGKALFEILGMDKVAAAAGVEMRQGTWLDGR